jgi:WD40 repeat protein
MDRAWLAVAAMAASLGLPAAGAPLPGDIVTIDYAKAAGLVAAAGQGGQVVVWEFSSGNIRNVFQASGDKNPRSRPLARFSADGRRLAYTSEGEAGLIIYNFATKSSTPLVPRRLLYLGIVAASWSRQEDSLLVAIGRDVVLIAAGGQTRWKRRLETQSVITDVVWQPSEQSYTVATDDTAVSSYDTVTGQLLASSVIDEGAHSADVKVAWTSGGSALAAVVRGKGLALLDPGTLKSQKRIPCNCIDFDWSPAQKELIASAPPDLIAFTAAGQRTRDMHTAFDGASPVIWVDDGHILSAASDSSVVLHDARSPKIVKTFAFPGAAH